jgi:hypothetical protein
LLGVVGVVEMVGKAVRGVAVLKMLGLITVKARWVIIVVVALIKLVVHRLTLVFSLIAMPLPVVWEMVYNAFVFTIVIIQEQAVLAGRAALVE